MTVRTANEGRTIDIVNNISVRFNNQCLCHICEQMIVPTARTGIRSPTGWSKHSNIFYEEEKSFELGIFYHLKLLMHGTTIKITLQQRN